MIKRLRIQFISITMVLVTLMLVGILAMVFHSTKSELQRESVAVLMDAGEPMRPNKGENGRPWEPRGCFVLSRSPRGALRAAGDRQYDLTDEAYLQELWRLASESGEKVGVLQEDSLRFCRLEAGPEEAYAFMDITAENNTIRILLIRCVIVGAVAFVGFFVISLLLSAWMIRPVEKAWQQQRQFVADASHELKTPLTVILTNAELLQSDEYDEPEKARFAESIHIMSTQMRGLVEGLLELARADNGSQQIRMETVDLSELVESCVLPFEPVYFENGRELTSQIQNGVKVTGSSAHLRQVVEILLDNGCKYSLPDSRAELTLEQKAGHCLLRLRSHGQSMSPQQCRDIFKRFYRGDQARSMNRSYGLGLAIAETIVQRHKGKIWAQSENGINTFFVWLPNG